MHKLICWAVKVLSDQNKEFATAHLPRNKENPQIIVLLLHSVLVWNLFQPLNRETDVFSV